MVSLRHFGIHVPTQILQFSRFQDYRQQPYSLYTCVCEKMRQRNSPHPHIHIRVFFVDVARLSATAALSDTHPLFLFFDLLVRLIVRCQASPYRLLLGRASLPLHNNSTVFFFLKTSKNSCPLSSLTMSATTRTRESSTPQQFHFTTAYERKEVPVHRNVF